MDALVVAAGTRSSIVVVGAADETAVVARAEADGTADPATEIEVPGVAAGWCTCERKVVVVAALAVEVRSGTRLRGEDVTLVVEIPLRLPH